MPSVGELLSAEAVRHYRARARELMNGNRTEEAFSKFEVLERRADFAVHSAKDLPQAIRPGIAVAALLPARLSAQARPPWRSMISRTMLSPSPAPPPRRLRLLSPR